MSDRIKKIGKEMGASCQGGSETFHDNFAYEDGTRQQYIRSTRLRKLMAIRNEARFISDPNTNTDKVSLSSIATYKEVRSDNENHHKIGSFIIFVDQKSCISYNSPMARILTRGKVGDIRECPIGGRGRKLEILKIE